MRLEAGRRRAGVVRIWAEPVRDQDGSVSVRFGVTDNGAGMSEECKRRAFEMFYTTKPRGMGTGLGLMLVRRVAERAGGTAEIHAEECGGTTVVMVLPAERGAAPPDSDSAQTAMVLLEEARVSAMVRQLLEARGVCVRSGGDPLDTEIWVAGAGRENLRRAVDWRRRHPEGLLVVVGPVGLRPRTAWRTFGARIVEDPNDLVALRAALKSGPSPA